VDHEPTLVDRFEAHRSRLRAVAQRILGDGQDADDAVREAWLHRSPAVTPEDRAVLADSLGGALLVVPDLLSPSGVASVGQHGEVEEGAASPVGRDLQVSVELLGPAAHVAHAASTTQGVGPAIPRPLSLIWRRHWLPSTPRSTVASVAWAWRATLVSASRMMDST